MKRYKTAILALSCMLCLFNSFCSAQEMMVSQPNVLTRAMGQLNREEFQRVGIYKVKGNSYVLEGANVSDIYTTGGFGNNLPLVFDAYSQKVSIIQANKTDIATLSFEELDSFVVKTDNDKRFYRPTLFINAAKIEPGNKKFFERLLQGPKYGLYKSYKADMRKATSDLAQTNIMEFEIVSEYFYLPAGAHEFVKIKPNLSGLKKQFALETEALQVLNSSTKDNFQDNLVVFFEVVNAKK